MAESNEEGEDGEEETMRSTIHVDTINDIEDVLVSEYGKDPRDVYSGYPQDTLEIVLETLREYEPDD